MRASDAPSVSSLSTLVDRLAEEMVRRWRTGERPTVEDYLPLYPQLHEQPEAAIELIYEELCLRQEHGQETRASDLLRRFPQWQDQLRVIVECHQFLDAGSAVPRFPGPGERLGDFRLVSELGRGAHGRVFLATQPALADRPVVLKLIPRAAQEHLSLARLQHTHIVPLYAVQDDPGRGLRALCLPYFGGATLHDLLGMLHGRPPARRTGRDLLEALRQVQAGAPIAVPVEGAACQFLERASYVRAICWLGICLAEALQYTHERGLVHLDLKPSNVLWAADGQPMLLDLHLARGPIPAGAPAPAWLGGSPAYMAPEHRLALAAVSAGRDIPTAVDGRADLYSLGLVLCEALGEGLPPPGREVSGWLRRGNPQVSVGLADILGKCLAEEPQARYRNGASLAADLQRHLADLPLRGVANRSLAERWRKWRRRRPYGPALLGVALAVALGAGLALSYVVHETNKARAAFIAGQEHLHQRQYTAARDASQRGLALAAGLPFCGELTEKLRGQLRLAECAEAAQELHLVADRVRALYGADGQPTADMRVVEARCRTFWEKRDLIMRQLGVGSFPEHEQVRNDLLDLAVLWADFRVRLAGKKESNAVRKEALEVLAQAEELFGPSFVLECERQAHRLALGLAADEPGKKRRQPDLMPRTAWEHYAVGRALLRAGDLDAADAEFDRALTLQPQAVWTNFDKGKCAYQRGRYDDAVLAFGACVVLAPESAWCFYNRGLACEALGQTERARRDYDRALQLEPSLAPASVNRGMLNFRARRYAEALADLQRGLDSGADPVVVHYDRALVHLAEGDRNAALASVRRALEHDPEHQQARSLAERLRAER
jgi:serine/threonine protein kinase/Flp pilus assembly protein TadD